MCAQGHFQNGVTRGGLQKSTVYLIGDQRRPCASVYTHYTRTSTVILFNFHYIRVLCNFHYIERVQRAQTHKCNEGTKCNESAGSRTRQALGGGTNEECTFTTVADPSSGGSFLRNIYANIPLRACAHIRQIGWRDCGAVLCRFWESSPCGSVYCKF